MGGAFVFVAVDKLPPTGIDGIEGTEEGEGG